MARRSPRVAVRLAVRLSLLQVDRDPEVRMGSVKQGNYNVPDISTIARNIKAKNTSTPTPTPTPDTYLVFDCSVDAGSHAGTWVPIE